jgi:hypothetical protein
VLTGEPQNFSCAFLLANPEKLPYDMKIDSYLGGVLFLALWIGGNLENLFPDNRLLGLGYGLDQAIDPNFARDISFQFRRGQDTDRQDIFLSCVSNINKDQVTKYSTEIFRILTILVDTVQEEDLNEQLKFLEARIPKLSCNSEDAQLSWNQMEWCSWSEKLRNVMIQYRDIGHVWMLDQKEYEHLKQYYNANLLLIDCLNSNRRIPAEFRADIIETLLLPAAK